MRGDPTVEPMTALDKRCILALKPVRGLSANAERIAGTLTAALQAGRPITLRMRHALYAICWRFRKQLPMALQVKVAIAAADAHMHAMLCQPNQGPRLRVYRSAASASTPVRNPLDDLFTETH